MKRLFEPVFQFVDAILFVGAAFVFLLLVFGPVRKIDTFSGKDSK